jgi:hypothetical protein
MIQEGGNKGKWMASNMRAEPDWLKKWWLEAGAITHSDRASVWQAWGPSPSKKEKKRKEKPWLEAKLHPNQLHILVCYDLHFYR